MTPRARRLTALSATAAIAATVAVGTSGAVPLPPDAAPTAPTAEAAAPTEPARQVAPARPDERREAGGAESRRTDRRDPAPARPAALPRTAAPTGSSGPVLDRDRSGKDALHALGDRVDEVAARSGLSTHDLVEVLQHDDSAWVTGEGQVFYREPQAATVSGSSSGGVTAADVDTSTTFTLHSRPGAERSIVLDVDGADVSGTQWATRTTPLPDGRWPGWNSEGSASDFTATEHAWVQEVWRQVAQSYAAFDVDVTTDSSDPSVWSRSDESDQKYGARVVITSSPTPGAKLCGDVVGCAGQSFTGVYGMVDADARYQPAWVFATPDKYGDPMSPLVAAQTAAHEVGHQLGLVHDGITVNGVKKTYYDGTTTWGPLMGAAMTRGLSHWSKGEYAGATSTQDDLAVIGQKLAPVTDEAGDTIATAKPLPAAPAYDVQGVIGTRTDLDVYRLDVTCPTTLTARATAADTHALDLRLDLFKSDGTTVTHDSPLAQLVTWPSTMSGLDASLSTALATPGSYYLRVDGVGQGSPSQAGVGWSDYGSLGRYRLQASTNGCVDPSSTPPPSSTPTPTPSPTPPPVVMTKPGAPVIGTASSGASGGTVSATARWAAPKVLGGQKLLGYRVRAYKLDSRNRVVRTYTTGRTAANVGTLVYRLPKGRYSFVARAENALGASGWSARSRIVTAR